MNPTKQQIDQALDTGERKTDVFARFRPHANGAKQERQIAFWIASHPSTALRQQHRRLVLGTTWLMAFQALLAVWVAWGLAEKLGTTASWTIALLALALTAFFAWGFSKSLVGAYTGFIALSLTQMPRALPGLMHEPITTSLGLGMVAYIWYVRSKLFPDMAFFGPKKVNGFYQFAD